jgi:membrane associated rhomboid family serine protease
MFLPIGDTPNPPGRAYVNWALIGLNVVVFLFVSLPLMSAQPDLNNPLLIDYLNAVGARGNIPVEMILRQVSAYDLFVFEFGYRPAVASLPTLFSAMFLHAGWMHLLGNMLFLYIFGDNVEHRLGRFKYLLTYLAAGVAAALFFALFAPNSQLPMIGASGAISGVLGLYFVWFPRNRVKTFVFFFPFIMQTLLIPCRFVLGFYLVVDNLLPFLLRGSEGGGVAHGAHIGGFLAGLGIAWYGDRLTIGFRPRGHKPREKPDTVPGAGSRPETASLERLQKAVAEDRLGDAAGLYARLPARQQRHKVDPQSLLAIGRFLLRQSDWDGALAVFRRFIAEHPSDPAVAEAYLGAGRALMYKPRCLTSSYHYLLSALDTAQTEDQASEIRALIRQVEQQKNA